MRIPWYHQTELSQSAGRPCWVSVPASLPMTPWSTSLSSQHIELQNMSEENGYLCGCIHIPTHLSHNNCLSLHIYFVKDCSLRIIVFNKSRHWDQCCFFTYNSGVLLFSSNWNQPFSQNINTAEDRITLNIAFNYSMFICLTEYIFSKKHYILP